MEKDYDSCSGSLNKYRYHSMVNTSSRCNTLHLPGDVVQSVLPVGWDLNNVLHFI